MKPMFFYGYLVTVEKELDFSDIYPLLAIAPPLCFDGTAIVVGR
jgi:hypothetical protein